MDRQPARLRVVVSGFVIQACSGWERENPLIGRQWELRPADK